MKRNSLSKNGVTVKQKAELLKNGQNTAFIVGKSAPENHILELTL